MWTLSSVNLKSSLLDDGLWLCADILVPGCALVRAGPTGAGVSGCQYPDHPGHERRRCRDTLLTSHSEHRATCRNFTGTTPEPRPRPRALVTRPIVTIVTRGQDHITIIIRLSHSRLIATISLMITLTSNKLITEEQLKLMKP